MTTTTMLGYLADQIEAALARHRISGRVTGGSVGPRWVRFKVLPRRGKRLPEVSELSDELAAALDAENVRVARQGAALQVEVERRDPQPVSLMPILRGLRGAPPVTAVLGLADDGLPLLVRLPSPDVGHALVAGGSGSGKTTLLRTIALSLAWTNPREELLLVLIDPKGQAFADLGLLPQLARPVVTQADEGVETLSGLVQLMERRERRGESAPAVVVLIDELTDLMIVRGAETERKLMQLLQHGHEAGIHVVAATREPTGAAIGSLAQVNFLVRLVGKVSSAREARAAAGRGGTGAERLAGQGDFVAVAEAEGRLYRFQAAYVSEDTAAGMVMLLQEEPLPIDRPLLPSGALPAR